MSSSSSSRATYIPRSYLASLPPDSEISMGALVAEQDRLADEAREAMPYAFDECSYGKGYVRQSVWSCIGFERCARAEERCVSRVFGDHGLWRKEGRLQEHMPWRWDDNVGVLYLNIGEDGGLGDYTLNLQTGAYPTDCGGKGVCYGCSISCHADHQLVELWTRRHFRCDCPTSCTQPEPPTTAPGQRPNKRRRCALNPPQIQPAEDNVENRYNRNFKGEFCRCGRVYDPLVETEGMLCCVGCEDWLHESCLNLRQPATITKLAEQTPVNPYSQPDEAQAPAAATNADDVILPAGTQETVEDEDDEAGVLIPSESYDCLLCAECVNAHPALASRAGKEGWMVIVQSDGGMYEVQGKPEKHGGEGEASQNSQSTVVEGSTAEVQAPKMRSEGPASTDELGAGSTKRALDEHSTASDAKRVKLDSHGTGATLAKMGRGDIFLAHGEREKLTKELDADTIKSLPFPLDDEEIYEPPKDDNKEETLDEVTARMVNTLPRAQAIEAVHGYQRLKDRLQSMLAGHAVDGRVVSKDDIEAMFADLRGRAS